MSNPTVGLAALTLKTPVFTSGATTLSVDSSVLPLVIQGDLNTLYCDILIGDTTLTLSNPVVVNGANQFTGSASIAVGPTAQIFQLSGRNYNPLNSADPNINNPLLTPTVQYELLYLDTQLAVSIAPPSGVTIYKGQTTCRVEWALPTFNGFEGVRVQWSTDVSGVTVPYQQFGNLVADVTRTGSVAITAPATTTANNPVTGQPTQNQVVVTTTNIQQQTNFCSATIPVSLVQNNLFYCILTTVIQDPNTNAVYESLAAGPFTCGYVNLKVVNPTDFLALQKATDIAARMITEITRREPNLDLTARSELRDIVINPLALELATMSVREWFARCCQSISAISQIDDQNGDGVSDPFTSSSIKQQIARAYGLSAADTQTFIDQRFDVLGEQAGVPRGGSTTATVALTFYVYAKPLNQISIQAGVLCSTIPDASSTTAVQFVTTGSGVIDPSNAASYYDATNNWWSCTVPAQCSVAGSTGNVGAGTIQQVTSGGPSGVSVTNLLGTDDGTDRQSNADYAAMIQDRLVTGVDSGSRNGYTVTTLKIPGITDVLVVAAGDTDMLRDWSSIIQRHTYGCVDVYTRGGAQSQQTELVPFSYATTSTYGVYSTYLSCTLIDPIYLRFKIAGFSGLAAPLYTAVEMVVTSAGRTIWLGKQHAQFDNVNGLVVLDPSEITYVVNADGSTTPWQINGVNATNKQVITAVGTQPSVAYYLMARLQTGLDHVPTLQPILAVDSLTGPLTGSISSNDLELVYTNDFLLTGGSNDAGDTVTVSPTQTITTVATLVAGAVGTPVVIDSGIALSINANGAPLNVLSVRSSDASALYEYGVDYTIVSWAPYHTYAITLLAGGAITPGATILVAYNKYLLNEFITYQTDTLTLTGTTATALTNPGFIANSWLPVSYGNTMLMLDGYSNVPQNGLVGAGTSPVNRYIKVSFTNVATGLLVTASQGQDFTLAVDQANGTATISRVSGGAIPDNQPVTVNYFTNETFTLVTEYPTYVQQAITAIDAMKHAAADVLVKAMVSSGVDITMVVNLAANVTPESVDGRIRTAIGITLNNAQGTAAQSQIVSQVQLLTGITSIQLPLVKCAKSDGAYVIGQVITTGTQWNPLSSDASFALQTCPPNSYITENPVITNSTLPSGGPPNAYVGLLYEGQSYLRCLSIQQFLTSTVPSFYIIGNPDQITPALTLNSTYQGKILITVPSTVANPGLQAYRVTYVCYGNAGVGDVEVSSPEYLVAGNVNLLYSSASA